MRPSFRRFFPLLAVFLAACGNDENPRFEQAEPGEALSGGNATVMKFDQNAFSMPSANLAPMRRLDFSVGNSFFRNPWVIALRPLPHATVSARCSTPTPARTVTSRTGAGIRRQPMPPVPSRCWYVCPFRPARTRRSRPRARHRTGAELWRPAAGHGDSRRRAGGGMRLRYSTERVRFADGSEVELRRPEIELSELGYGDMHPDTLMSPRIAPPMIGLGLLEAIPEKRCWPMPTRRSQWRRHFRPTQSGVRPDQPADRHRPFRLEGRPAEPQPAERRRLLQRHGTVDQPVQRQQLHRAAGRMPGDARRRRAW